MCNSAALELGEVSDSLTFLFCETVAFLNSFFTSTLDPV